jgi:ABC-type antimicrobial peptide transport system permease subunit
MDATLPLSNIVTMDDVVGDSMSRTSFTMSLLVLAAFVALFLGSVGIYGVISYVVSQRTSELGVRMALGADAASVRSLVLKNGMVLAVIGVVLGLVGAAFMSRMLSTLLFGISQFDPYTFVAGPIVFLAIAALACIIPAQRAAGIDPADALRSD